VAGAASGGMTRVDCRREGWIRSSAKKSDLVGGTAPHIPPVLSGVPGNSRGAAAGHADTLEAAQTYFNAVIRSSSRQRLRHVFLEAGHRAIDCLNACDIALVDAGPLPDYQSEAPGAAMGGRVLIPAPFDGRLLGNDFKRVRPPLPELHGARRDDGQQTGPLASFATVQELKEFPLLRSTGSPHMSDRVRYERGTRLVMGNALVARLFYSLRRQGVPIMFKSPVKELVVADGAVVGAVIECEERRLRVRAAVASYLPQEVWRHDRGLIERYLPRPADLCLACPSDEGDGLAMGENAAFMSMPKGRSWVVSGPLSREFRVEVVKTACFPHFTDLAKPE